MVLAIDVGNSNIVLGGYLKGEIQFVARIATNRRLEADQYAVELRGVLALHGVSGQRIEGIVISSVVPGLTSVLRRALSHLSDVAPMVLGIQNAGDIQVLIDHPVELGMDILASAIAVKKTRPLPAVIIDMGTATKLTALDAEGNLQGVCIYPGLFVSLEALLQRASLLQGIALEAPSTPIGKNTQQSLQSGLVLGSASLLDGMIGRFEKEIGPSKTLVATGGAAPVVVPHCERDVEISSTLVLDGLYQAYTLQGGK